MKVSREEVPFVIVVIQKFSRAFCSALIIVEIHSSVHGDVMVVQPAARVLEYESPFSWLLCFQIPIRDLNASLYNHKIYLDG